MREEEKMLEEVIVSDCCNAEMTPLQEEYGLCPKCGEHCETSAWPVDVWPGDNIES